MKYISSLWIRIIQKYYGNRKHLCLYFNILFHASFYSCYKRNHEFGNATMNFATQNTPENGELYRTSFTNITKKLCSLIKDVRTCLHLLVPRKAQGPSQSHQFPRCCCYIQSRIWLELVSLTPHYRCPSSLSSTKIRLIRMSTMFVWPYNWTVRAYHIHRAVNAVHNTAQFIWMQRQGLQNIRIWQRIAIVETFHRRILQLEINKIK